MSGREYKIFDPCAQPPVAELACGQAVKRGAVVVGKGLRSDVVGGRGRRGGQLLVCIGDQGCTYGAGVLGQFQALLEADTVDQVMGGIVTGGVFGEGGGG